MRFRWVTVCSFLLFFWWFPLISSYFCSLKLLIFWQQASQQVCCRYQSCENAHEIDNMKVFQSNKKLICGRFSLIWRLRAGGYSSVKITEDSHKCGNVGMYGWICVNGRRKRIEKSCVFKNTRMSTDREDANHINIKLLSPFTLTEPKGRFPFFEKWVSEWASERASERAGGDFAMSAE